MAPEELQARPKKNLGHPNVSSETTASSGAGKCFPKKDVFNKFVMVSKLQLVHVNGLTYDFLYGIAKELEGKGSLLVMGAGPKANQPLILRPRAVPYRAGIPGRPQPGGTSTCCSSTSRTSS